ncbi:MAG: hypothetical protein ACKVQU_13845 [Burkholderiales bacterium]
MRSALGTLGIEHHVLTRLDDVQFMMDRASADEGPQCIAARTDASPPAGVTERDAAKIRGRFMEGISAARLADS